MKLSKEDLIKKINEKAIDEDIKVELIEDVSDSFEVAEVVEDKTEELEEMTRKYEELREKYKERFLSGSDVEEEKPEDEDKQIIIDANEDGEISTDDARFILCWAINRGRRIR